MRQRHRAPTINAIPWRALRAAASDIAELSALAMLVALFFI